MDEEVQALEDNHTWQIVDPPSDAKVLGGKWVYKIKRGVDGKPSRYKARWVVKRGSSGCVRSMASSRA